MIGAVIFVIFFILFLAVTLEMPTLPPGDMIHDLLAIPRVDYPVLGIPASLLITAIVNGVVYGFIIWLMYTIASYATRSRKKEESQPYAPPPQPTGQQQYRMPPTVPPPQHSPPPATPPPQHTPPPTPQPPQQTAQPVAPPPQTAPPPVIPIPVLTPQPAQAPAQPAPAPAAPAKPILPEEFAVSSENLVDRVKELLHEGNVTRIIVKDEKGKILFDMPASVGVAGTIAAPWLAGLGAIAALATKCTISVVRKE